MMTKITVKPVHFLMLFYEMAALLRELTDHGMLPESIAPRVSALLRRFEEVHLEVE